MPQKCCVTGCKSNYDSTPENQSYVSIFRFPDDEALRKKWLQQIPRKDWTPTANSRVCELHFDSKFVSKFEVYTDNDGQEKTWLRKRPILSSTAVPTIFPNVPSYLSSSTPVERTDPAKRRKKMEERHEKTVNEFLAGDIILDYSSFIHSYTKHVNGAAWKFESESTFIAYITDFRNQPVRITSCIKIDDQMHVEVFQNGYRVPASELSWLLGNNCKLGRWSQFENLLKRVELSGTTKTSKIFLQETILSCLEQLSEYFEEDTESSITLNFLKEQFELLCCTSRSARRYSSRMMLHAFMIHLQSSSCYDALRRNSLLILPHENRLIQLTQSLGASVEDARSNKHYLKLKSNALSDREKFVVVQIDEIYVKSKIDYKNGKLYGHAENSSGTKVEPAKTIYAVLASSAFGHFKEIVSLRPVSKITSTQLTEIVKNAAALLRECGLKVVVIISDNNAVNRKLFDNLCGQGLYICKDEMFEGILTFCTFDSVHIGKSWRNNWLNQKDAEKTFVYPDFENLQRLCFAKFSALREIYEKEKFLLVKTAPRLSHKTVYPSKLERQKVILALNIWHDSTVAAVKEHAGRTNETAVLLQLMSKWWDIMNIQNQRTHILKRNEFQKPFTSVEDERFIFFENFLLWLTKWKPVEKNSGFLTKETYSALYRQVQVMNHFVKYALTELKISYVLTGKLQTDMLEKRFGQYRNLSGSNYNISVVQVLESEKKLRVKSLLGLKSARYGEISFDFSELDDAMNQIVPENMDFDYKELTKFDELFDDLYEEFFIEDSVEPQVTDSGLIFICGYVSFKLKTKLNCNECLKMFLSEENIDNDYFKEINRGGLSVPTDLCVHLGKLIYITMQKLISEKYEVSFINCSNQRGLLVYIVKESLFLLDFNDDEEKCTACDVCHVKRFHDALKIFSNILLNNYSKCKNNIQESTKSAEKAKATDGKSKSSAKRKLSTLKK